MQVIKLYLDAKSVDDYVHANLTKEDKEKYKDQFFFMYKSETCIDGSVEIYLVGTPSDKHPIYTNPRRSKIDLTQLLHNKENS